MQEDASEFFTTLLESMAKSILAIENSRELLCTKSNTTINNNSHRITTTIFDLIFSFQFHVRITCSCCNRVSDTIEFTNTWHVDIEKFQNMEKSMANFLRDEVLEGENVYNCEVCNKKTRAFKKYSILTAPNILVIHFKRFVNSYPGKLTNFVSYPEKFSLDAFIAEPCALKKEQKNSTEPHNSTKFKSNYEEFSKISYELYGVLVHCGESSYSGHYYSYVRGLNDVWYIADDKLVRSFLLDCLVKI